MTKLNARNYPRVYDLLRINLDKLGCIMLDVEPFPVVGHVPNGHRDLFFPKDRVEHPHLGGAPAENEAHCTLLYGLLRPGPEWSFVVNEMLKDWEKSDLEIESLAVFPGNTPGEDYSTIVGKVKKTDSLLEGNARLRMLPHIDTFPDYSPHITLAYVKNTPGTVEKWTQHLESKVVGKTFKPTGINYGD